MRIKIEDLKIGDEILLGSKSSLKYVKVIRPPRLSKRTCFKDKSKFRYKAVKCSAKIIEHKFNISWGSGHTYTRIEKEYEAVSDDHNKTMYIDLNYRDIWLIKRQ